MPHVVFSYQRLGFGGNEVSVSAPSGVLPNLWTNHVIASGLINAAMATAVGIGGGQLHIGYNRNGLPGWLGWDTVNETQIDAALGACRGNCRRAMCDHRR